MWSRRVLGYSPVSMPPTRRHAVPSDSPFCSAHATSHEWHPMHASMLKPNRYCSPASSGSSSGPCVAGRASGLPTSATGIAVAVSTAKAHHHVAVDDARVMDAYGRLPVVQAAPGAQVEAFLVHRGRDRGGAVDVSDQTPA